MLVFTARASNNAPQSGALAEAEVDTARVTLTLHQGAERITER